MIASVVVTLDQHVQDSTKVIHEISLIPCVELGRTEAGAHRLPVMIDSPDPDALEEITRRLQQCCGVAFVDVVFVHFENEWHTPTTAT